MQANTRQTSPSWASLICLNFDVQGNWLKTTNASTVNLISGEKEDGQIHGFQCLINRCVGHITKNYWLLNFIMRYKGKKEKDFNNILHEIC